jgi:hypothetical protein
MASAAEAGLLPEEAVAATSGLSAISEQPDKAMAISAADAARDAVRHVGRAILVLRVDEPDTGIPRF